MVEELEGHLNVCAERCGESESVRVLHASRGPQLVACIAVLCYMFVCER